MVPVVLSCIAVEVQASQEDYLASVTAEVNEFKSGKFDSPAGSPWVVKKVATGDDVGESREVEEFGTMLQDKFPGTFMIYKKLPGWKKRQVYELFTATGDIDKTKAEIFRKTR